jgi:PleD family two-component response regulator
MSKSILIVDDTPDNLRLMAKILSKQAYHVRVAPSGAMALNSIQIEPPDLILLDIMMPQMGGYEVCQRLKADEQTRHIPVIFISALNGVFDKMTAFSVGGVDFITKPFEEIEVLARIKTHLMIHQLQHELQQMERVVQNVNEDLEELQTNFQTLQSLLPTEPGPAITTHIENTLRLLAKMERNVRQDVA